MLNGFRSSYGQRVRVIGNCPELGGWDREKSFPLEYINDNMWIGHLPVKESSGKAIAYKFIVEQPDGSLLYENRPAHFRHLPKDGFLELQHRWC
jgi:cyclomaltodextrin glucanotransferase